jgi:putative membrane protein
MHYMTWGFGGLMMIVWWVILIGAGVIFFKWVADRRSPGSSAEEPLEILKRRFVRGEISREEFHAMKRDLIG